MGFLGSVFGSSAYSMYYNNSGNAFAILFYISMLLFIGFLLLIFVHFTMFPIFSFSPNDPGFISVPTVSDRQITYKRNPPPYDMSGSFISLPECSYTLGADIFLSGNFMVSNVPRVILYRSEEPVEDSGTVDSLDSTYPDTNIIVWLDPVQNDLYASVATSQGIQTTEPIENVPIRKSFRLTVAFSANFIELYINGKLEKSMPIRSNLKGIASNSYIYPSIKPIMQNVMIGNLSMWPRVLTAREIALYENAPVKATGFFPAS
jgi:hypothetical protein